MSNFGKSFCLGLPPKILASRKKLSPGKQKKSRPTKTLQNSIRYIWQCSHSLPSQQQVRHICLAHHLNTQNLPPSFFQIFFLCFSIVLQQDCWHTGGSRFIRQVFKSKLAFVRSILKTTSQSLLHYSACLIQYSPNLKDFWLLLVSD